jgi:hypothetical protein
MGAMGALAPAIFKVKLLSTHNFLTFYYCQAGVCSRNGKILNMSLLWYFLMYSPVELFPILVKILNIN